MNFFDKLKAQVNPFDGGKSFGNPQGNQRQALPMRAMAQAMQPRVGQAQVPFSQETADRYNADPTSFVGKNAIDPKYFGYPADDSGSLQVQTFGGMQPNMQPQSEDEYTPAAALENTGYFNPQTTMYGHLQQGSYGDNQQGTSVGDIQRIRKLLGY